MPLKVQTLVTRCAAESPVTRTRECIVNEDFCKEVLEHYNGTNRPHSKSLSKLYASEFLLGRWHFNGESVIFATDENGDESLASGQHRLYALLQANEVYRKDPSAYPDAQLEFRVNVTAGVPLASVDTIDQGKIRNHQDVLFRNPLVDASIPEDWNSTESRRKKWCKTLATAARLVWQRNGGKLVSSAEKFNTSEMLTFIEEQAGDLPVFVTLVLNADDSDGGHKGLKGASLAYQAALCYLACYDAEGTFIQENQDRIEEFLSQLATGTGFSTGDPAHALTGFWNSLPPGTKDRDTEVCGPYVKCLNAVIQGTKVTSKKLKLTVKEVKDYKTNPPLLEGWDTACFEAAAAATAEQEEAKEQAKRDKEEEKARKAEERAKEQAKRDKEEEKARKAEERAKAKESTEEVVETEEDVFGTDDDESSEVLDPDDIPEDDESWEE